MLPLTEVSEGLDLQWCSTWGTSWISFAIFDKLVLQLETAVVWFAWYENYEPALSKKWKKWNLMGSWGPKGGILRRLALQACLELHSKMTLTSQSFYLGSNTSHELSNHCICNGSFNNESNHLFHRFWKIQMADKQLVRTHDWARKRMSTRDWKMFHNVWARHAVILLWGHWSISRMYQESGLLVRCFSTKPKNTHLLSSSIGCTKICCVVYQSKQWQDKVLNTNVLLIISWIRRTTKGQCSSFYFQSWKIDAPREVFDFFHKYLH